MNKNFWRIAYLVALAIDLFAVYSNNETLQYITKPVLMPLLVVYFVFATRDFASSLKKWIIIALLFSWAGDVFLMCESMNENFFILGLASFLWAHIMFITFFQSVIKVEKIGHRSLLVIPGLFWLGTLIDILDPASLGLLRWPVEAYGIVLITMLTTAFHIGFVKAKWVGLLVIPGALLFVISDSILALNKFYQPIENAGIAVMATYGVAQLLITLGAVRYITSTSKQ